jgi:acyl-CoA synthetase (NDP forming)
MAEIRSSKAVMTEHSSFPAQALFEPQSVAVVGVPRGPKVGQIFLQALLHPGYKGRIYPINPNADEIMGLRCYASISALPETPDLAILVVGSDTAIEVIGECADRGVKAAALFTAGFSEAGTDEGRQRQERLLAAARRGARPVRILGPNCMALYVPKTGLAMFPNMPSEAGSIAFVSQSGSLCTFVAGGGYARGLAFSKVISIGNQADLNASDFFEYLADDPETEVVGSYLEGVRDGRRFFRALERCVSRKPVVIWKAGRTHSGARAANSHTGALAGQHEVWSAMLRQVGALTAHDMDELLDLLVACRHVPRGSGRRVAILAGPGGPAVSASDACEENGLELPRLSAGTQEVLRGIIPMAGTSVRNPVDMGLVMLGAAEMYYRATEAAALDPNVDAILAIGGSAGAESLASYTAAMQEISQRTGKPIMQSSVGGEMPFERVFADHGIATFGSPERALWAYARVTGHAP